MFADLIALLFFAAGTDEGNGIDPHG